MSKRQKSMELQFVSDHKHEGQDWMSCMLCSSLNHSKSVLYRTKQRKVEWPQPRETRKTHPAEFTDMDDAFSSMLQYMNTTSRKCMKFYKTCAPRSISDPDNDHLSRFHTRPKSRHHHYQNPIVSDESVHIRVQPGTYAVTLGEWATGQKQKHIVNVDEGQSVELQFVM